MTKSSLVTEQDIKMQELDKNRSISALHEMLKPPETFGTVTQPDSEKKQKIYMKHHLSRTKEVPIFLRRTASALKSKYGRKF